MNSYERLTKNRQELVNQILQLMEEKGLEWKRGWSTSDQGLHYNPVSGNVYHGGNQICLMLTAFIRGYTDNRWVTKSYARTEGWSIRPDAPKVTLEKWIFYEKKKEINPDTGKEEYVLKKLERPKVSFFSVYNAADVIGIPEKPARKTYEHEKDEKTQIMDHLIQSSEAGICFDDGNEAYYQPLRDEIHIPKEKYFESREEWWSTILHEMGHATGHESRLNRPQLYGDGADDYAKEELTAELSAVFTQAELKVSLPDVVKNNAAYIKSYIQILKDDPHEFFRAAQRAGASSDRLIKNYETVRNRSEIIRDLQKSGYFPEEKLVHQIEKFNEDCGTAYKVEDFLKMLSEKNYPKELKEEFVQLVLALSDQEVTMADIKTEIQKEGYQPTEKLIQNIWKIREWGGEGYGIHLIRAMRSEPEVPEEITKAAREVQEELDRQEEKTVEPEAGE